MRLVGVAAGGGFTVGLAMRPRPTVQCSAHHCANGLHVPIVCTSSRLSASGATGRQTARADLAISACLSACLHVVVDLTSPGGRVRMCVFVQQTASVIRATAFHARPPTSSPAATPAATRWQLQPVTGELQDIQTAVGAGGARIRAGGERDGRRGRQRGTGAGSRSRRSEEQREVEQKSQKVRDAVRSSPLFLSKWTTTARRTNCSREARP